MLPLLHPLVQGGRIATAAGEIAQLVSGESFRYLAYIEFAHPPGALRGNHYHLIKQESLYILRGRLQARYQDMETGQTAELLLETGDLVQTQPGCAHAYRSLEYTQALEFAPTPFDPADSYRHVLSADIEAG